MTRMNKRIINRNPEASTTFSRWTSWLLVPREWRSWRRWLKRKTRKSKSSKIVPLNSCGPMISKLLKTITRRNAWGLPRKIKLTLTWLILLRCLFKTTEKSLTTRMHQWKSHNSLCLRAHLQLAQLFRKKTLMSNQQPARYQRQQKLSQLRSLLQNLKWKREK